MQETGSKEKIADFLDYYLTKVNVLDIHLPDDLIKPETAEQLERRFHYIYVDQIEKITQMLICVLERPLFDREGQIVSKRLRTFLENNGL